MLVIWNSIHWLPSLQMVLLLTYTFHIIEQTLMPSYKFGSKPALHFSTDLLPICFIWKGVSTAQESTLQPLAKCCAICYRPISYCQFSSYKIRDSHQSSSTSLKIITFTTGSRAVDGQYFRSSCRLVWSYLNFLYMYLMATLNSRSLVPLFHNITGW